MPAALSGTMRPAMNKKISSAIRYYETTVPTDSVRLPIPQKGGSTRATRLTVCLPDEYFEKLGAEAERLFKPRATLAAELLRNYLDALGGQ